MADTNTYCAIKRITNIKTKENIADFHRQIAFHASLPHITILPFVGYEIPFRGSGNYTIITKFIPNGTLQAFLNQVETGEKPEKYELIKSIRFKKFMAQNLKSWH